MTNIDVPKLREFSQKVADSEARMQQLHAKRDSKKADAQRLKNLEIFGDDNETRAARDKRVTQIAAGETLPPTQNTRALLAAATSELADLEAACEFYSKQHEYLRRDEGSKLRQSLKPAYDVEGKRLATALVEAHSALCTMERLKRDLTAQGLGFYSVPCCLDTDLFGSPFDRTSDFAQLLRQMVENGYLKQTAKELR